VRTTLNLQAKSALIYTDIASTRLADAQERLATGKRIRRPSDDVPGTNAGLSLRSSIRMTEQLANNIVVTKPLLSAAQDAVADLVKVTKLVRDIAIAAANPELTGSTRTAYLSQLDDILNQMVDLANTKHLDQYIFSGTATNTAPLVAQSGPQPYAYAGNSDVRRVQILAWVTLPTAIPGDRLFNFDGSAGTGTTDLFTMVAQLKSAIASGDSKAVSAELNNIDANLNNLLACNAQLGSWIARIDRSNEVLADTKVRLQEMLSQTEDIDLAEATLKLKTQEHIYQAALIVSSRMLNLSLASLTYMSA